MKSKEATSALAVPNQRLNDMSTALNEYGQDAVFLGAQPNEEMLSSAGTYIQGVAKATGYGQFKKPELDTLLGILFNSPHLTQDTEHEFLWRDVLGSFAKLECGKAVEESHLALAGFRRILVDYGSAIHHLHVGSIFVNALRNTREIAPVTRHKILSTSVSLQLK